jgi:hypothetical protein
MRFRIAIALLVCGLDLGASAADGVALAAMVARLDDDSFGVRQRAMAELLKVGEAAVPTLEALGESASPEQRARAAEVLGEINRRRLERGFGEIGKSSDHELDVEQGMILIAQILDPQVTGESVTAKLDEMAGAVRESLGEGIDPKALGGAEVVEAITSVLRDQYHLAGDVDNYDHPDNSSIHRVLEKGDGLPIVLSEIAVAVGRRLGVPLVGVGIPGRYMFMYDGSQAPAGEARENIIVDAFGGWVVKQADELEPRWMYDPLRAPRPSLPRETLARMLRNMGSDFLARGDLRRGGELRRYEALIGGAANAGER